MELHSLYLLVNQTLLFNGLQNVAHYLEGPTLVYHDGNFNVDDIVNNLSNAGNRSLIIVRYPQKPALGYQHTPRSTVLLAEEPQPLVTSLRKWDMWQARSRVLVILGNENEARGWITALWQLTRAVDVVAMTMDDNPSYFTWFPYQENECSDVSTITQLNSSNLFQPKIGSHLNNCPLYAVTSLFPPVVVDDTTGVEPMIFLDLTKKLGMKPTYVRFPPNIYVWIKFDSSGEPTNAFKLLYENQVDVLFGSLAYNDDSEQYCEFLPSHTEDAALFFVPGPKVISRATAIYRAFSPTAWLIVIASSASICVVLFLLEFRINHKIQLPLLRTLLILLNLTTKLTRSRFYNFVVVFCYFYSMHITTGYQSSLLMFLSDVPHEKPVTSLEDLAATKMTVFISRSVKARIMRILESNKMFSFLLEPGILNFTDFIHLERLVVPGITAVLGPKLVFTYVFRSTPIFYDDNGHPRVNQILGELYKGSYCFYISSGHPLFPILHKYTYYLMEGGFPQLYLKNIIKPPRVIERNLDSFGLSNVVGPFILWLSLMSISFFIFLSEVASVNVRFNKVLVAVKCRFLGHFGRPVSK